MLVPSSGRRKRRPQFCRTHASEMSAARWQWYGFKDILSTNRDLALNLLHLLPVGLLLGLENHCGDGL